MKTQNFSINSIIEFFLTRTQKVNKNNILIETNMVYIDGPNANEFLNLLADFLLLDFNPYHDQMIKNVTIEKDILTFKTK